jgi:hypothetical protein
MNMSFDMIYSYENVVKQMILYHYQIHMHNHEQENMNVYVLNQVHVEIVHENMM